MTEVEIAREVAQWPISEQRAEHWRLLSKLDRDYAQDPWLWLTEQVWTQDEASGKKLRWPEKEYLKELVDALNRERLLAIPKSRRMMATWCVAAWCAHRARYQRHQAIFIQSESESKAAFVVDQRCKFIEDNLDAPELRRPYLPHRTSEGLVGKLDYIRTSSYLNAIAQGGEKIRTYTPSVLVMDEVDFQPEAHDALTAALPAIEKGAHLVLISTSNGPSGVLAQLCSEISFTRFC